MSHIECGWYNPCFCFCLESGTALNCRVVVPQTLDSTTDNDVMLVQRSVSGVVLVFLCMYTIRYTWYSIVVR